MTKIAIIGNTRSTEELLNLIEEKSIEFESIHILDLHENVGKRVKIEENNYKIEDLSKFDFSQIQYAFVLSSDSKIKDYIVQATKQGVIVIDKGGFFIEDYAVPLVIDNVNDDTLNNYSTKNIVSTPNCITTLVLMVVNPIHKNFRIKRMIASTYQSVSGVGSQGLDELFEQTRSIYINQSISENKEVFTKQIAFNLIPHIGKFMDNGNTSEEESFIFETKRILGAEIEVSATCVRVPIFIGHSFSINVELEENATLEEFKNSLIGIENVSVVDYRADEGYVSPFETIGEDRVFVSRIRQDNSKPNSFNLWIVGDNLKVGIALNMINIYEKLKFLV
jgi:aspartate-semialdehyde dehydrogenase